MNKEHNFAEAKRNRIMRGSVDVSFTGKPIAIVAKPCTVRRPRCVSCSILSSFLLLSVA